MNDGFATARVYPGDTDALIKNLMHQMDISDPNEAVRRVNAGEWVVHPIAEASRVLTIPRTTHMVHPIAEASKVLTIPRTNPFDPPTFVGEGFSIWRGPADGLGLTGQEAQDARALLLTEVDFTKVTFETALRNGESQITGEEKLSRLIASGVIRLDAGVSLALWNDYEKNKAGSMLEWLRKEKGITYLDFFGTILHAHFINRYVPYLGHVGGGWRRGVYWLGHDSIDGQHSCVLAS